ncbi:sugar phosphate isomerase/epimerase family protein [Paenibacillus roseipurpureus]|uniref:Sugar phosphate isomerase/epimerase family protein n=1 Tax=Paenibacillus roseopurpureus TaxID=2918901 RepID=A0AA96LRN1_9BACL|nr:sugar phosphate isomerase/epimerase family protein [Paenibacillus sp. MBLB1832]WNR46002.1 sugar phosphate isomerase/epimerase family protein [Paenibacillus sp. MBLB1832]
MQLGLLRPRRLEVFQQAQELGLRFVEFACNVNNDLTEFFNQIQQYKRESERTGVSVGSIGRWGSDRINKDGSIIEEELEISYQLIDAAQQLGCPLFVCGCNYVEELSLYDNATAAIQYFTRVLEYGKSRGVRIATYNCHWNCFVVDDHAWRLIHGHLPDLGIKYDPSHSRQAGQDYIKEARDWGHRFYHVHLKGSVVIEGQRFDDPPAGMDQTDWPTFMSILYTHRYSGKLSIEPHSETWRDELWEKGVRYTIDYFNKLLFR